MKLDWQHVALLVVALACAAGAVWFGTRSANPAIVGIGVTVGGGLLTTIAALFKPAPQQTQTTTLTLKEPVPPEPEVKS